MSQSNKKDYCTCFFEEWEGIDISPFCRNHDNNVGEKGTYNPFTPHIQFYKDLRDGGISIYSRVPIVFMATIFTWIRQPYFWYRIYKYRNN